MNNPSALLSFISARDQRHQRLVELREAALTDLLAFAVDHDTGALYERIEQYKADLAKLTP